LPINVEQRHGSRFGRLLRRMPTTLLVAIAITPIALIMAFQQGPSVLLVPGEVIAVRVAVGDAEFVDSPTIYQVAVDRKRPVLIEWLVLRRMEGVEVDTQSPDEDAPLRPEWEGIEDPSAQATEVAAGDVAGETPFGDVGSVGAGNGGDESIDAGSGNELTGEQAIELINAETAVITAAVAARFVGGEARVDGGGMLVVQSVETAGHSVPDGSVVTSVGDDDIHSSLDFFVAMQRRRGATARLGFRNGTAQSIPVAPEQAGPCPRGRVGGVTVDINGSSPVDRPVRFDRRGTDGSSAGLSMTLAAIEALEGKPLAPGKRVVASGVVDAGGCVSQISQAHQKALSARKFGADLLLVAPGNEYEANLTAGDVPVVAVSTVAEAVEAVRALNS
jgi:PDZ domain-containing secreted protein